MAIVEAPRDRVRGVAFDAVGTLIEPWPTVAVAYAEAAARQRCVLDVGMIRDRFARAFAAVEGEADGLTTDEDRERDRWRTIVAAVLPEVPDVGRAFDELWDHFGQSASWRAFPDAEAALDALRAVGIATIVASNFDGRLRGVLAGLPGLEHLAEGAVTSTGVGHRKPHPAFYRAACAAIGLPAGSVVYVGDDPAHDLEGPRAAGLRSLLLDRRGRHDPIMDRAVDLVEAVGRLAGPIPLAGPGSLA